MEKQEHTFSGKKVTYYFDGALSGLNQFVHPAETILIVDEKVDRFHGEKLSGWRKIVVKGTEDSKTLKGFEYVISELIRMEADRKTILIGIGGGVITDLTGFVGSVYMRGISYAFVPTSLLAQVDAAVGGKNGVNFDRYKNILGIIRQPEFLLFDYSLLDTLEYIDLYNGFAEIIKYACICDSSFFEFLESHREKALKRDREIIGQLVHRSVKIKTKIVQEDEFEGGLRRLLNFGHTIGHAVEKLEKIPHGQAVAKGMVIAAQFSGKLNGLPQSEVERLAALMQAYHLPIHIDSKAEAIRELFKMDKKREKDFIHFVLLKELGKAEIKPIGLDALSGLLQTYIPNKLV